MYDVLAHYIAEGLVLVHAYPHPDEFGKKRGRIFRAEGVELRTEKNGDTSTLYIKHNNVWVVYPIDAYFFEEYAANCSDRDESVELGRAWMAKLREVRESINLKELV